MAKEFKLPKSFQYRRIGDSIELNIKQVNPIWVGFSILLLIAILIVAISTGIFWILLLASAPLIKIMIELKYNYLVKIDQNEIFIEGQNIALEDISAIRISRKDKTAGVDWNSY